MVDTWYRFLERKSVHLGTGGNDGRAKGGELHTVDKQEITNITNE